MVRYLAYFTTTKEIMTLQYHQYAVNFFMISFTKIAQNIAISKGEPVQSSMPKSTTLHPAQNVPQVASLRANFQLS